MRHSFGSSDQRILAVLATLPDGVDSMETLAEAVHLSTKTIGRKVGYLVAQRIVETDTEGNRKRLRLADDWYETMVNLAPALTSWGQDIIRARQAALQQIAHHEHMAKYTNDQEKKDQSLSVVDHAEKRLAEAETALVSAKQTRRNWMKTNGKDPNTAPPISLHPRSNPKPHKPAIHVNGHDLTPGDKAKIKPNGLTKTERAQQIQEKLLQADMDKATQVPVTRLWLGCPLDGKFGTVEQIGGNRP